MKTLILCFSHSPTCQFPYQYMYSGYQLSAGKDFLLNWKCFLQFSKYSLLSYIIQFRCVAYLNPLRIMIVAFQLTSGSIFKLSFKYSDSFAINQYFVLE